MINLTTYPYLHYLIPNDTRKYLRPCSLCLRRALVTDWCMRCVKLAVCRCMGVACAWAFPFCWLLHWQQLQPVAGPGPGHQTCCAEK